MQRPDRLVLEQGGSSGALQRTAVSHIGFSVPDLARSEHFYTRVLGMQKHASEDGALFLGWGAGHHVLELREGDQGLLHYGFEIRDDNGVERLHGRLTDAGFSVQNLDDRYLDDAIGSPAGLLVHDPDGNAVHFHGQVRRSGENAADTGRRPIKFQHTTVGTEDVVRMANFFVDVVGFRISDQLDDGRFAWLRSDRDHHTLALVQNGAPGDIDHYSYDLAEWEDFKSWCDRLTELDVDVTWGPGRHGPGNNLFVFFDDPAGNHIELSAEMEKFWDDRVSYVPRRWTPAPQTVNLWGGQTPVWRKTSQESI